MWRQLPTSAPYQSQLGYRFVERKARYSGKAKSKERIEKRDIVAGRCARFE